MMMAKITRGTAQTGLKPSDARKKWGFGPKIKPHLFGNEERAILRLLIALSLMLLLGAVHKKYLGIYFLLW